MRLPAAARMEAVVPASPEAVWAVLSDVTRVGEWSHETQTVSWIDTGRPVVGARFVGHNLVGKSRWSRVCTITDAEQPTVFEYVTWGGVPKDSTRWRFELTAVPEGTRIVQTFEILKLARAWEIVIYLLVPPHRNRSAALAEDLIRLGQVASRGVRSS